MADEDAPRVVAGERETLVAFLDYLRASVVRKVAGLSTESAARTFVPSGTSLAGLVRHLTVAERYWFQHVLAGEQADWPVGLFDIPAGHSIDALLAEYADATAVSAAIVARFADLDDQCARDRDGFLPTARWVLVHMIEETGRHAGHADITRELIDGQTGR